MEFDETMYVEAGPGAKNLTFNDEKQQARFELAVAMMVYKWDALVIAVDNGWGGPESAEKRDWLTAVIIDLFKNEKSVDAALIEETMLYAMVDEFDTTVEDDSALPIAVGIINRYKECAENNYSVLEELYVKWSEKEKQRNPTKHIHVHEDPLNPDSSADEEEEELEELVDDDEDMGEASKPEPVVDEDGFELVQKKGGRR